MQSVAAVGKMLQFIGAELSPFTAKVRGYLRYKKIPFEPVLCNLEIMKNVVKPRVGWSVVPVVVTPENEVLQDSTDIIHILEKRYPEPSIYPSTPKQKLVSQLLELYADEWLFITAMHYRWSFPENRKFLTQEFGKASFPKDPEDIQRQKGERICSRFGSAVQFLGIDDSTKPELDKGYTELLDLLTLHFDKYPYLLGYKPTIGDFAIFGQLYAMFFRDPAPGRIMRTRAPVVAAWVENMNQFTTESRQNLHTVVDGRIVREELPKEQRDFLPNDHIPETLYPLLEKVFKEHGSFLISTAEELTQYMKENPEEQDIPRTIGATSFTVGNTTGNKAIMPYCLWMLQGITDLYNGLSSHDKSSMNEFLEKFKGAKELVNTDLTQCRVDRVNVHVRRALTPKL